MREIMMNALFYGYGYFSPTLFYRRFVFSRAFFRVLIFLAPTPAQLSEEDRKDRNTINRLDISKSSINLLVAN